MGLPSSIRYPSDESLETLLNLEGIRYWKLNERYRPCIASVSLKERAKSFSQQTISSMSMWLIEANGYPTIKLASGLLAWGTDWLYETNCVNRDLTKKVNDRLKLNIANLLAGISDKKSLEGALPSGWWRYQGKTRLIDDSLIYLSTHNNLNYYHWWAQPGITPLFLQDYFSLPKPKNMKIAVSKPKECQIPSYVMGILDLVQPNIPRITEYSMASIEMCRFSMQELQTDVVVSPKQMNWVKEKIRPFLIEKSETSKKLFISRKNAKTRRCLNEKLLYADIENEGFLFVELERLSVLDQLQLFFEASVIVGVHGAGFSNIVACRPGTKLVELLPNNDFLNHYYLLSSILGMQHAHIVGINVEPKSNDFTIEIPSVRELLILIGAIESP